MKKNSKGVTLLEALLALSIISLALAGILRSFYLIDQSNFASIANTQALLLAEYKINDIILNKREQKNDQGSFEIPFNQWQWRFKKGKTSLKTFQHADLHISWDVGNTHKTIHFSHLIPISDDSDKK